jgi:hypothetical protein
MGVTQIYVLQILSKQFEGTQRGERVVGLIPYLQLVAQKRYLGHGPLAEIIHAVAGNYHLGLKSHPFVISVTGPMKQATNATGMTSFGTD